MIRKRNLKYEEDADNHERWLVSYADFITLLFAFFVVMYAISSINDGKYKVLSHSLVNAFKSNTANTGASRQSEALPVIINQQSDSIKIFDDTRIQSIKRQEKMKGMAKNILKALEPLVNDGKVRVTQSALGVTVEINASVLFSPGQAKLAENSSLTLQAVAQVIKDHDHQIHVEGHTDNLPIFTENFPSNWELSTARASSVIRLFIEQGVDAQRLTAIGYGEYKPVETNDSPEGRKRNRRVSIMILSKEPDKVMELPVALEAEHSQ
ncbi:MAG: flagellar motor protein MotD [Pseudomonadota bacterium]